MSRRFSLKSSTCMFTLFISLMLLTTLTACANADSKTDASSDTGKKSKQRISKDEKFAQLENEFDARIGVYAIDTGTKQTVAYHPNERFAYTSTFKVLAAAILLKQNDIQELERVIPYTKDDLVTYSPVTEKHVDDGMTLLEISEAAIRKSDNTAGNLLLEAIGGPDKFEQALRNIGDDVTQPERYETELNEFKPGNKRDTSTPKAMAANLKKVALSDFLSKNKRELLIDWMKGNATGDALIRAGAPEGWKVGDKSGAGSYGTRNDIAIVWPPNREPIVIAVMSRHNKEDAEYDDALVAKAAEITLNALQ
ncbi:class A beta-lactamase [Virgibacillus siamensis]|uniref:class A beta-lactamase n=1 Tax=Virgibacillus siamensis TaxID=480071 RepID=UPI001FEC5BEB|nr:class A beta-lactamase [Virgibacillus siamensis]